MALRSHCRPNAASRAPTTRRSAPSGIRVSAGPIPAVTAASTISAAVMPWNVERHSLVRPAASTMVSASTASTRHATMTVLTSQTSARDTEADAIIVGVVQGSGGALPAPGAEDVDAALDDSLAATLSVLGATGKAEEVTKIATAGRLAAPLIVAVGLGAANGKPPFEAEALRRAAGAGVRALAAAKPRRVALALPARDDTEAAAVALGALLGGYEFGRYRGNGQRPATELTLLGGQ